MISVCTVKLEDLKENELELLVKYCNKCFEPVSIEDLVSRIRSGLACVYRFDGDCSGVFVLAAGDNGLFIETVAGTNVVEHFDTLYDKIKITAAAAGAQAIYSYAARPALKRLYERKTKAKAIATLYKEDLL